MNNLSADPLNAVILVVDDDSSLRRLARMALEHEGHTVFEADNGQHALDIHRQIQPDVVLLDILMPGMDGIETCARLKAAPEGKHTLVLMLTALEDQKSIRMAFEAGAVDFLTKPIQWFLLNYRVRRLIELRRIQERVAFQASLLDQVHSAVIAADEHKQITYWNQAATTLYQWSAEETLGKALQEFYLDTAIPNPTLWHDFQERGFWQSEGPAFRKDHSTFTAHVVLTPIKDAWGHFKGLVRVSEDVSERVQAAHRLHESWELYRTLINNFPNGAVFLFDRDLRFVIAGGTGIEIAGLAVEQIEGNTLHQVFPAKSASRLEPLFRVALDGKTSTSEISLGKRIYQVHMLPVKNWNEEIFAGMMLAQDITTLKQAQEVLEEHHMVLETLVEQRTSELKRANQILQQEIAERQRAEAELHYRAEFKKLITTISTQFINLSPDEIDTGIDQALKVMAEFAGVDRSYVFLFSEDGAWLHNTYEWCAADIAPQKQALQGIPSARFTWWITRLRRFETVYIPHVTDLPYEARPERHFFESRQNKSVIAIPMIYNGNLTGFLGFDSVKDEKSWPSDMIASLRLTGDIFVRALEHKRTSEALHKSERQLRQITDTMLDSVYQTDADGIFQFASPSCWELFGCPSNDLLGQSIYDFVHPDDLKQMKHAVRSIGRAEYRCRRVDGRYVWVETLSNLLFGDETSVEGIVFASRDITERKRAERELTELNRLKTEFLSTAAHELRTPLTSIRGFSEILVTRQLPAERQMRYLHLINDQSTHLGRIIDDLLDISRLEAKKRLSLTLEAVDIGMLVRDTAMPFTESASSHQFIIECAENIPPIQGDAFRLSQVLKNLLSNAVKYSPQGGKVSIQVKTIVDRIEVSVRDDGIGITPEQQTHLFEKFYRADASNTAISGTGLGLAISKLIVELHGGNIWVKSEFGKGTTLFFTLPLTPIEEDPTE